MKFLIMVASIVIVLSIMVAFIRGGQLDRLKDVNFRMSYLAIAALLLDFWPYHLLHTPSWMALLIFLIKYLLLFAFILLNCKCNYMKTIGIGIALNFFVIFLNGGAMPVSQRALQIPSLNKYTQMIQSGTLVNYTLMTAKTPLWFLGDIIYIPWPKEQFISIGDIVIMIGIFLFIQHTLLVSHSKKK